MDEIKQRIEKALPEITESLKAVMLRSHGEVNIRITDGQVTYITETVGKKVK